MLFSQFCQEHSQQSGGAFETAIGDLIGELNAVSVSLLPSLQNVAFVGIFEFRRSLFLLLVDRERGEWFDSVSLLLVPLVAMRSPVRSCL